MQPIYLLALARKTRDKSSKLTRVARCSYVDDSIHDGRKVGAWWSIEVFDNPIPSMLDPVFIGLSVAPGVRAAEALAERMVWGLGLASGVKWECSCGPIDADDAVLLRVELAVA